MCCRCGLNTRPPPYQGRGPCHARPCVAMPSQMGTTNIALRCQNNLAMPDKIWSCSARPFLVLSGCCQTAACCQGAVKNFCNDDTCTTKNHRGLGALGDCSERQIANNFVGRRGNWSRSALSCWRHEDVGLRVSSRGWRTKGAITNIQARLMARGDGRSCTEGGACSGRRPGARSRSSCGAARREASRESYPTARA